MTKDYPIIYKKAYKMLTKTELFYFALMTLEKKYEGMYTWFTLVNDVKEETRNWIN
jgi:hypothetical protein